MKFIYIHGFNSGFDANSPKIKELENIGTVVGMTYDSFAPMQTILAQLEAQLEAIFTHYDFMEGLAFIGTSLGGFFADQMCRKYHIPAIAINPCHTPDILLADMVGKEMTNYITGKTNTLTKEVLETYENQDMAQPAPYEGQIQSMIILDMGDEVIDSRLTFSTLVDYTTVKCFEGGSHRFDHMSESLTDIEKYVNYATMGTPMQ